MSFRGTRLQRGGIYTGAADVFNKSMKGIKVLKAFFRKVNYWLGLKEPAHFLSCRPNHQKPENPVFLAMFSKLNPAFISRVATPLTRSADCSGDSFEGWHRASWLKSRQTQERKGPFLSSLPQFKWHYCFSSCQMVVFTANCHKRLQNKGTNLLCVTNGKAVRATRVYLHGRSAGSQHSGASCVHLG